MTVRSVGVGLAPSLAGRVGVAGGSFTLGDESLVQGEFTLVAPDSFGLGVDGFLVRRDRQEAISDCH